MALPEEVRCPAWVVAIHVGVIVNYNTISRASLFFSKGGVPQSTRRRHPLQIVGRDLEFVAVGIGEINGMRNLIVLKFESNAALFQFFLSREKVFVIRAEREVKHSNSGALGFRCGV